MQVSSLDADEALFFTTAFPRHMLPPTHTPPQTDNSSLADLPLP